MSEANSNKRRFSRVPFEGTGRLHLGERLLPVDLLDISVRGAQIRLPKNESVQANDECRQTLMLDDSPIHLTLESQVRHISDDQAGLVFVLIDLTDMQHLRRIVERSEEHTSELQSRPHLVCRLLLEKKKKTTTTDRRPKLSERRSVMLSDNR